MDEIIKTIKKQFECPKRNEIFPDFISNIHFPYFKGLERDSVINFTFPLTVLVGENGCGKSSVLQALENCIEGQSYSQRWFSTTVDPISDNDRPCFWYTYYSKEACREVEILNTRINKLGNPDYWEPSRPVAKYGMKKFDGDGKPGATKTRWNGTKRKLIYLDFRAEITAFDKYFYFEDSPYGERIRTKQDFIRKYSWYLMQSIKGLFTNKSKIYGIKRLNSVTELDDTEVKIVSSILDKEYTAIKVIFHSFYKKWGESVYFSLKNTAQSDFSGNYSEAFAGSGESAVAKLVYKINRAQKGTLVLLDEPEVSLHPGAQKRTIEFLLEQIKSKGLQIVLSTHSPAIVEKLPSEAIKVLSKNDDGKFHINQNIPSAIAFEYIGQTNLFKTKILVEDEAAKELIISILNLIDSKAKESIVVEFHNGGASDLYKESVVYSRNNENKIFLILDGDKKLKDIQKSGSIADNDIDEEIRNITNIDVKNFMFTADSGKETEQLLLEKKGFIDYMHQYLTYFPTNDPEEIIWNASLKRPNGFHYDKTDFKEVIKEWVEQELGTTEIDANDIKTYRKKLLSSLDEENPDITNLKNILNKIIADGCVR